MKKDWLYAFTCLGFSIMIGGAVYEHLNVVPKWSAAPPVSLSMFQGEHGLKPELFWMLIHPLNLLLFAVTLGIHWRTSRKKNLVQVLGGYVLILAITSVYFVPELISITTTAFSPTADPALTQRAKTWEAWSLVRLAVLLALAMRLFMGLAKSGRQNTYVYHRGTIAKGKHAAAGTM